MRAGGGIFALRSQPGPDGGIDLPGAGPGQTILSHLGVTPRAPRKTADVIPDIRKTDSNTLAVTCCCCPWKPQVLGFLLKVRAPFVPIFAQIQAALDRSSASIPRGGLPVSSHRC